MKIPQEVIDFFSLEGSVIVTTIDALGLPHNSCKGIGEMKRDGKVYVFDLYRAKTYQNLTRNLSISITAVDEHLFKGYSLKGKARIVASDNIDPRMLKTWEDKIAARISARLIKNIRQEKGHPRHPEAHLPKPKYLIEVEVKEIVDLSPYNIPG